MSARTSFWHPFADMAAVGEHEFVVTRGEGVHVWDQDGRRYIDAVAGLWYCHIGHGRSEIADAVATQMRELESYWTCCAAALANLDVLERDSLIPRGRELEDALVEVLAPLAEHPACAEVRGGVGLMAAVELSPECQQAPEAAGQFYEATRDAGVIVRGQPTGVAIGPPLTIETAQLEEIGEAVAAGLDAVAQRHGMASPSA